MRQVLKQGLGLLGLGIRQSVTPGVSAAGKNLFFDRVKERPRSAYALDSALELRPKTVLDVGSGGGEHARAFQAAGAQVTCVDFGTSVYSKANNQDGLNVIHMDFTRYDLDETFEMVWASHVLEHQHNVGMFIGKLLKASSRWVCITVPDPHRALWGGHVTLWTPGILAYNIVLAGADLSQSQLIRGTKEFSILFEKAPVTLPSLSYDQGDIDRLSAFMPPGLTENSDGWKTW